ncbi:MAG: RagB/SusD family nutrient uptake outer membrane protein [Chlorobi bacterium]|nr:RagB/SusD family nutrient uptake outer membrane protein [Chlorobiota bacterium]
MKYKIKISVIVISLLIGVTSCLKDLDTVPIDKDEITSATLYKDPAAYRQVLAKLYAGLTLTGQEGPAGQGDLVGIDEGFSSYLRNLWNLQELPTDEAVNGWSDDGLSDFHDNAWTSSNPFVRGMYFRIYYQLTLANEFIRQSSPEQLDFYGIDDNYRDEIANYRSEARFLRALSYYHALDMFGNVPFVTEDDKVGAFLPEQIKRADLFTYIENELLDIENKMVAPMQNERYRADRAAVWTLLAKLYLNAEVYTGQPKYTECLTYCKKVIAEGYSLEPTYANLFLADNDQFDNGAIFTLEFDGLASQTWGGTTFLVHAAVGGSMSASDFGIDFGWGGNRTTSAFVNKFADITGATDSRAMFYTSGQNLEIDDIPTFTEGYAITKYKNITSTGQKGSNETHVDNDFQLFRLADVYLMYAEAVLRGGTGGDNATALTYVNLIRERAYGDNSGNIASGDLTLDFILDERARELYWECQRRTDLIRFGKFAGDVYIWPWKGGVKAGTSIADFYQLYPIPADDITANPNLVQNTGY